VGIPKNTSFATVPNKRRKLALHQRPPCDNVNIVVVNTWIINVGSYPRTQIIDQPSGKLRKAMKLLQWLTMEEQIPKSNFFFAILKMNFPSNDQLLRSPNIWIGDTAATMHMTPYKEGMINCKKSRGGITVGNGEVMITNCSGDLPCEICDRHGKVLTKATTTEVALTKNPPFNSFSLTKMMDGNSEVTKKLE
jgi:hypothetical protein